MPTSARLHVDTGFVGINGGELYYESAGAGPQVVLLHGGNLDSRMWDSQFEILARQHRVVRYDARGFGRSSAASVPYAAHEDLLSLLDTFHIERASLVGLSLGGRIAIDFALAHPSRVDRLVLASPGLSGWSFARGDTSWGANWRLARARDDSVGMATAWLASAYMKPAMERVELQTPLRDLIRASAGYWMGLVRHGDTEAASEPPALGRTGLVHAPTLLIVGSRDVPDILHIADTLAATIAHVHKVVIPGVGHMVNLEASAQFNSLLLDFLR
jgi:pimeloyl-ACP methyl ester carboxylesterase